MPKLLLNLRNVPDDELEEVQDFLEAARIDWYQTRPGPFGITAGGIWIRDEADFPQARRLMTSYQQGRVERVRAARAQAERDGTAETFADIVRRQPLRVALTVVAVLLLLGLMALPAILLGR